VIIEKMTRRFNQFMTLLADEPATPQADPALRLFEQGWSINQTVSKLMPTLGGPTLIRAQQAVEHQARVTLHRQAAKVGEQSEAIEEWRRYAAELLEHIEALQGVIEHQEHTIAGLRRALAQARAAE
jgi:hypothetical protein